MSSVIDSLISPTLKHLRERWWDDDFTEFLSETLKPRPGNRILDVGCGEGLAEISIGRLHISQIRLVGVDLVPSKVVAARHATAAHNQRVQFAVADACRLSFVEAAFDSIYCVAVLQHVGDVDTAVAEFARVTRRGGRVVAVEPDNTARYAFSATAAGHRAFDLARRFFEATGAPRGDATDASVGPKLPAMFAKHGIEPIDVRLFPVSHAWLHNPAENIWAERHASARRAVDQAPEAARSVGREYLEALRAYEAEARHAGASFVEIQHTMLFATVGQRG